ncbi:hypothetical protein RRSWK_05152 [Rhodopirellula sp. SWK7]|nr:hypothetical protein RRSWK_05152 [Rhodopirellula sp. SWK7]
MIERLDDEKLDQIQRLSRRDGVFSQATWVVSITRRIVLESLLRLRRKPECIELIHGASATVRR